MLRIVCYLACRATATIYTITQSINIQGILQGNGKLGIFCTAKKKTKPKNHREHGEIFVGNKGRKRLCKETLQNPERPSCIHYWITKFILTLYQCVPIAIR